MTRNQDRQSREEGDGNSFKRFRLCTKERHSKNGKSPSLSSWEGVYVPNFLHVFLTSPVTYLTSHVFPLKQLSLLTTVIARMARVLRKGNLDVPRSYMSGKYVLNSALYLGAWLSLPPNIKIYN